jgi:hypothetical protein
MNMKAENGKYVCAENGGGLSGNGSMVANRDAIGAWETFQVVPLADGWVALKTSSGHYVCAEGGGGGAISTDRVAPGIWESFKLLKTPDGSISSILCWDGIHIWKVRADSVVDATASLQGSRFRLEGLEAPAIKRLPLPAFPLCGSCPAPHQYFQTLPWEPPDSRDFLRMDAWGVELPGLPVVPGASSEPNKSRTRVLTYLFDRWNQEWQAKILATHAGYGYTHFLLSEADSRFGPSHLSIQGLVDLAGKVKRVMPYVTMAIGSKVYNPKDMTPQQWADYAGPIMEALIAAKVVDEFTVWEWNLWNKEGKPSIDTFKWFGKTAHSGGCSFWLHFSTHVTSWFADGDPRGRFGFYDDLGTDVDGINYQSDPAWDIGDLQARIVDTLWQFGIQGNRHKFRAFELDASRMFMNEHPNEDEANRTGFLACCTVDNVKKTDAKVWGFGNGGRRPDGTRL